MVTEISEAAWTAKYEPLDGPTEGETGNWEHAEVQGQLATGAIAWTQVWTVVDDGETECAVSGWAVVNRMHHKVTKHHWTGEPGDVVAVLSRYCTTCGAYLEDEPNADGSWDALSGEPCDEAGVEGKHRHD